MDEGDEATTRPCDDEGVGACIAGGQHTIHVGGEVGGIGRGKDVIRHEFAPKQGASIAESGRAPLPKGVVGGDLDERAVFGGHVLAHVDGILVVVAAGAEGVLVKAHARDVVGGRRGNNQDDFVLGGQLLQRGGCARANSPNQDGHAFHFDEFAGDSGCGLGVALVVAEVDVNFAPIHGVGGVGFGGGADTARGIFHAEREAAHDVGAINGQRACLVGNQTNFDGFLAGEASGFFGDRFFSGFGRWFFGRFGFGRRFFHLRLGRGFFNNRFGCWFFHHGFGRGFGGGGRGRWLGGGGGFGRRAAAGHQGHQSQ